MPQRVASRESSSMIVCRFLYGLSRFVSSESEPIQTASRFEFNTSQLNDQEGGAFRTNMARIIFFARLGNLKTNKVYQNMQVNIFEVNGLLPYYHLPLNNYTCVIFYPKLKKDETWISFSRLASLQDGSCQSRYNSLSQLAQSVGFYWFRLCSRRKEKVC